MKQRLQGMLIGALMAVLLLGSANTAAASARTINIIFGVNVVVDGVTQTFPEDMQPFISEGRTFMPLRAIADALELDVEWDNSTRTAYLTSGASDTVINTQTSTEAVQPLVGLWLWEGYPYYVFNSDGSGMVYTYPINWSASQGTLLICTTPDVCGNNCISPEEWQYIIDGDDLILTVAYEFTRSQTIVSTSQSLVGTWLWEGYPFYVFNPDGSGRVYTEEIGWSASQGILSICTTPDVCGSNCLAPIEWQYEVSRNRLILTVSYEYTRG
ncbi:MAG: copper amine oxidase N-terminal domain-containing protein [Defluviitaleaceae bacterium]|nr:copper amine oxidase N-terminal domain-containing protein [Defluviitaleaceae bacterium]